MCVLVLYFTARFVLKFDGISQPLFKDLMYKIFC